MYRVPAPAVFYASKNKRNGKKLTSLYDPNRHTIWIRPRHMNINTAAHEAAHAIVDWILGPHGESHGREWVGVLMVLFDKLKIAPKTALVAYAKTTRLAFSTPGLVGPKEIRRRYAARAKLAKCERRLFKWYGQ
jgi:ABC-type Fe3+ transport system substrate-binding protein